MKLIAIDSSPRTTTLENSNAHSPPPNANRLKGFSSNNAISEFAPLVIEIHSQVVSLNIKPKVCGYGHFLCLC